MKVSHLPYGCVIAFLVFVLSGCIGPHPGPDKQGEGTVAGAAIGAGTGAITGAGIASAAGPGAAIGAGFGAIVGGIRGFTQDQFEDELLKLSAETRHQREVAFAQEVLADHYQRRGELHPTRDIFPADLFFRGDQSVLRPTAYPIIEELVRIHRERHGWSRFAIASYVRSVDKASPYATQLAEKRAEALGNALTRMGINPRRVVPRGVVTSGPVLVDPLDHPDRYSAAIEFLALDLS